MEAARAAIALLTIYISASMKYILEGHFHYIFFYFKNLAFTLSAATAI